MKILGISGSLIFADNHDASAALIIDGKLVGNYEEERFNRIKHSVGESFPINCIHRLLQENNLTIDDIDVISMPHDPATKQSFIQKVVKLIDKTSNHIPELIYEDHHMAHACDSFFQSGFDSAVCVIIDGSGDNKDGITITHIKDNNIKVLKKYPYTKSLGLLYSAGATSYANLGEFGEGKFMGLTSYGLPIDKIPFKWIDGDIKLEFIYDENAYNLYNSVDAGLISYFKKNCYPYSISLCKHNSDAMYYANFAASIQKTFNDIVLELVKYAKELTNEDNLILSGGCIQNCIANNLIVESGLFKNVFAGPAPHDAGCAAGLAFHASYVMGEKIENKRLTNSYVGKTYTDDEILNACNGYDIEEYNIDKVASLIKGNKIIGWFQGGSEIGPRALGHRSIIANPSTRNNLNIINNTIKHRENWRPLAPTVPDELFDKIFDTNSKDLTEFMLRTLIIRPELRKKLTAVCHIDNTTRPQCLQRDINPELYDLIMKFYKISGVPCIINTSFNGKGEPIIETPQEAINFLERTPNMDYVIFNTKYIIKRKGS